MIYDIIIIGSGIGGLYTAYNIKKMSPNTSFLILEKYKKHWIGGRTNNETFYGTEIVTGAGIGRKKDKLLHKLLDELDLKTNEFNINPHYSTRMSPVDMKETMNHLREEYTKYKGPSITFKTFAKHVLGEKTYKQFLITVGYTDYEKQDAHDTLYSYSMEDNYCCSKGFYVPWQKMVMKLATEIGWSHFKFSNNVSNITKIQDEPCLFSVETEHGIQYTCNKVVIATTITGIRKLLPKPPIYHDIEGQPFLRLYGKFSKQSIPIMKEHVKGYTCMPGPLQKIIPMDSDKGVYMIAYNDNLNTLALKDHLENTEKNRDLYCELLEQALGIPGGSLNLIAIKDFYWPIGTHYYKPLNHKMYKDRNEFIDIAQHPEKGILVVGEVVSHNQGWTEGALDSVKAVLTKKWITSVC
jgi:hypothetical protein